MNYPKIYMHRDNHAAQVVVANQQQEAQLPADFVPLDGSPSGATGATPGAPSDDDKKLIVVDGTGGQNAIATGLADLEERRAEFDKAADDFAKRVRDQDEELTVARQQVDDDRDRVESERKKLDEDRAYFEQEKAKFAAQVPETTTANLASGMIGTTGTGNDQAAAASTATPAKRTRAARE